MLLSKRWHLFVSIPGSGACIHINRVLLMPCDTHPDSFRIQVVYVSDILCLCICFPDTQTALFASKVDCYHHDALH